MLFENTTQKIKDWETRTPLTIGMNFEAPLVAPVKIL